MFARRRGGRREGACAAASFACLAVRGGREHAAGAAPPRSPRLRVQTLSRPRQRTRGWRASGCPVPIDDPPCLCHHLIVRDFEGGGSYRPLHLGAGPRVVRGGILAGRELRLDGG